MRSSQAQSHALGSWCTWQYPCSCAYGGLDRGIGPVSAGSLDRQSEKQQPPAFVTVGVPLAVMWGTLGFHPSPDAAICDCHQAPALSPEQSVSAGLGSDLLLVCAVCRPASGEQLPGLTPRDSVKQAKRGLGS